MPIAVETVSAWNALCVTFYNMGPTRCGCLQNRSLCGACDDKGICVCGGLVWARSHIVRGSLAIRPVPEAPILWSAGY